MIVPTFQTGIAIPVSRFHTKVRGHDAAMMKWGRCQRSETRNPLNKVSLVTQSARGCFIFLERHDPVICEPGLLSCIHIPNLETAFPTALCPLVLHH